MKWYSFTFSFVVFLLIISRIGYSQSPGSKIDFTSSHIEACAPAVITFNSQNVSSSSTVDWVVSGDTFTSRKQLRKLFIKKGNYDITMIVHKSNGKVSKKTKSNFTKIGEKPDQIKVNPSNNHLCHGPETVSFKGSGNNVQKWNWVVENKRLSDTTNQISHPFESVGYKDVTVKAISELGCKSVKSFDSIILIKNPIKPSFKTDHPNGFSTHEVDFKAQNKGSRVDQYNWQFPGANKSKAVSANPSKKKYQNSGIYDVALQLTTKRGCQYLNKKVDHIKVRDSTNLDFKVTSKRVCPGEKFQLTNKTRPQNSGTFKWKIEGPQTKIVKDKRKVITSLGKPGDYDVSLIQELNGVQQVHKKKNVLQVKNVEADFTTSTRCHCSVPTKVSFTNQSQSPNYGNTTYQWTFFDKDGQKVIRKSNRKNPKVTYYQYGKYDVRLITKHDNGCVDTSYKNNFVKLQPLQDQIQLDLQTYAVNIPLTIDFPEDSFCSKDSLHTQWAIYDRGGNLIKFSNQRNPTVTFKDSGTYELKLSVSTKSGCQSKSSSNTAKGKIKTFKPKPAIKDSSNQKAKGPSRIICKGDSITLEENTFPKVLNYKHKWTIRHSKDSTQTYEGWGKTITKEIDTAGLYDVFYQVFVDSLHSFDTLYKGFIGVRGADIDFSEEIQEYCVPSYKSKVSSQLSADYTYPSNVTRQYQWETSANKGINLKNSNQKQLDIRLQQAGIYDLSLKVTGSQGCVDKLKKPSFIKGGLDADFDLPSNACYDESSSVPNKSFKGGRQVIYNWKSLDKQLALENGKKSKDQKVKFQDSGLFKLRLTMEDQYGCQDTQEQKVNVERVFVDFVAGDTLFHCAPSVADFQVTSSKNVEQYHWDFGDGTKQKTTKTNISHAYNKNTGGRNSGYDVKITGESQKGCRETVKKSKYITVIGPVPDFEISKRKGCEKLDATFKKTGKHYIQSYMDYGDKSNVDSSGTFRHTYSWQGNNGQVSTYTPIMVAKDSLGCYAMKKAKSPVKVFKRPDAKFVMDTINGCEPLNVQFKDRTALPVQTEWDFDGDGKVESKNGQPTHTFKEGKHDIALKVKTKYGCRDTNVKPEALKVLETPSVDFISSDSVICPDESITFEEDIQGDVPINEIQWEVENEKGLDTLKSQQTVRVNYSESGNYDVKLTAINDKGCKGSIKKPDYVTSLDKIKENPSIKYVTSKASAKRKIAWKASQTKAHASYRLIRDGGFSNLNKKDEAIITDRTERTYTHPVNNKKASKHYKLYFKGKCGFNSDTSDQHKIPQLKVSSDSIFTNDLTWKPYKGWEVVSGYKILRRVEGENWQKIATVSGDKRQYRDRGLCRKNYCYRVVAMDQNKRYESYSNTACETPKYRDPFVGDNLTRATVKNGNVKVEWKQPEKWQPNEYKIARKLKGENTWEMRYKTIEGNSFIDKKANVKQNSYQYRVRAGDHCGNLSNFSNKGTAIHLKAIAAENSVQLKWDSYSKWNTGVGSYKIQVNTENKGFKTIGEVSGNKTKYTDKEINPDVDSAYEYRVLAFNDKGTIHSKSSKAWAVMPSEVYLPNAFSPNGDGLNEEFGIVGNSIGNFKNDDIKEYKLTIYNKWGQRIFKSNKVDQGWDGTDETGAKAPVGNYVYKIKAYGLDGKAYFLDGSVQLVR